MELLELSIKKLREENKKLYNVVIKEFNYDLVIFVARGSYLIGKDLADLNNVPLLEVFATRKGGKLKKIIAPILKIIPKSFKTMLRKKEMNSNYHEKNSERKVSYNESQWSKYRSYKRILLVDDSIDTGYSVKFAKEVIEKYFTNSIVKVAVLNYFDKSKNVIKSDFYLYNEKLLSGPWSNDSKENSDYIDQYYNWHEVYDNEK